MLNGWEIILILSVVLVVFAARHAFQPDPLIRDGKRALFYILMTTGAIVIGCLLALLVARVTDH